MVAILIMLAAGYGLFTWIRAAFAPVGRHSNSVRVPGFLQVSWLLISLIGVFGGYVMLAVS